MSKKFTIGSTIGDIIDDVIAFLKRNWYKLFIVSVLLYWTYVIVSVAEFYFASTSAIFMLLKKIAVYMMSHNGTIL